MRAFLAVARPLDHAQPRRVNRSFAGQLRIAFLRST